MSNALTPQNLKASSVSNIDLDQIQGDVLIGLQKFAEQFLFFQIKDVAGFKVVLRKKIANLITTTRAVQEREFHLRDYKDQGNTAPLPNIGVNLGFTTSGIGKLIPATNNGQALGDPSFAAGARSQAKSLGDPVDASGNPTTWVPQFLNAAIDGVFLITGGTDQDVNSEANKLLGILEGTVATSFQENGGVRPGLEKGHEHFGWLDGVSQPGISGLSIPFPGQRLLDPGVFVFGYRPTANPPLPWMKNGAFMVFRRLKQLVPEFDQYQLTQAVTLGMDPVLLGARLVGRWKSGAPVALTPSQDDSMMGPDPQRNNNFDFSDDQGERRCPFGAHIRKTNPRADFGMPNNAGVDPQTANVDPRRIIRAGIPFGPEVSVAETANGKTATDRGLGPSTVNSNIPLGPQDLFASTGGLLSSTDWPLLQYMVFAYKLTPNQVESVRSQLPKWATTDRYDIQARIAGNPTKDQFRLMMQSLLADRFKLAIHYEIKQQPIFALVLDKPGKLGPKIQRHPEDSPCSTAPPSPGSLPLGAPSTVAGGFPEPCGALEGWPVSGRIHLGARNVSIEMIATSLTNPQVDGVDRPVFDKTGLAGEYDFIMEFTPQFNGPLPPGVNFQPDESGPTFLEALKEQLGLKLDSQTGPVDVVIVDHVEPPSEN